MTASINLPIGHAPAVRRCSFCDLPTYAGRAMHRSCRELIDGRRRREQEREMGRFVGEALWAALTTTPAKEPR